MKLLFGNVVQQRGKVYKNTLAENKIICRCRNPCNYKPFTQVKDYIALMITYLLLI